MGKPGARKARDQEAPHPQLVSINASVWPPPPRNQAGPRASDRSDLTLMEYEATTETGRGVKKQREKKQMQKRSGHLY